MAFSTQPRSQSSGPIDALTLINFQAAMVANQIPDTGNVAPVISGVTYAHNTTTLSSVTAGYGASTLGVDLEHLFSLTDAAADGTYLIGRFAIDNISVAEQVYGFLVFGQGLSTFNPSVPVSPNISFATFDSLIKVFISVSALVVNGKALFSVGVGGFSPATGEYTATDMSNGIFTLSSTPLDVYLTFPSATGGQAFDLLPALYTDLT